MKKLFFLAAMCCMALSIYAYTNVEYDLWVKGERVTDLNKSNVCYNHKVSYDPTTKTLTINNDTVVASTTRSAIESNIDGLTINFLGDKNVVFAINSVLPAIHCTGKTTITTTGVNTKVWIYNSTSSAIVNERCSLIIDGGKYGFQVVLSGESGIRGEGAGADLSIKNTYLYITATTYGSIYGQGAINLNDCGIVDPLGAKISNGAIMDSEDNIVTSELTIRHLEKYLLYIADTQITELNYADVLGDGTVSYDPISKTLMLSDATISCSTTSPIDSYISELKLVCNGINTLSYTGSLVNKGGMWLHSISTITTTKAKSSLIVISPNASIYLGDGNVTVDGNDFQLALTLNGSQYGIYGTIPESGGTNLEIQNALVNISATSMGAICNVKTLTFTGVEVSSPTGCSFSSTQHALVKSDNIVTDAVVIQTPIQKYGLYIDGIQVTSENCNDILGDGGSVLYNNTSMTLTLNNANISDDGDIITAYQDMVIECMGNDTIESTGSGNAINMDENGVTFTGSGSLTAKSNTWAAIYAEGGLTVKEGCTLTAQSANNSAVSVAGESITVDGATLIAKGNGTEVTIVSCNSLILQNGAAIRSNHTYDAVNHQFLNASSEEAKDDIVIGLEGTGIEEINENDNENENVRKVMHNGQLVIIRDGKTYNAQGGRME